jgi:hypothetical protein
VAGDLGVDGVLTQGPYEQLRHTKNHRARLTGRPGPAARAPGPSMAP